VYGSDLDVSGGDNVEGSSAAVVMPADGDPSISFVGSSLVCLVFCLLAAIFHASAVCATAFCIYYIQYISHTGFQCQNG